MNSYDSNLQFTYELETEGTLPFLNVLIIKQFDASVHHKKTNADIYLNWFPHSPNTLKRVMLKMILYDAYKLYLTHYHLQKHLCYLDKVFNRNKNFEKWVARQIMKNFHNEQTFSDQKIPNINTASY